MRSDVWWTKNEQQAPEPKGEGSMSEQTAYVCEELGNFHNRDGWYFKRLEDGSVRIQKTETAHFDAPVLVEHIIPENEWASIVAHVSAQGESGETFDRARAFHAGKPVRTTDAMAGVPVPVVDPSRSTPNDTVSSPPQAQREAQN